MPASPRWRCRSSSPSEPPARSWPGHEMIRAAPAGRSARHRPAGALDRPHRPTGRFRGAPCMAWRSLRWLASRDGTPRHFAAARGKGAADVARCSARRTPLAEVAAMTDRLAKAIFWVGTLTSLAVFLWMTVETHRSFGALTHADALDDHVVAGKRAFERHNCNDCHTILGFGGYYAPDLTRAYARLGEDA